MVKREMTSATVRWILIGGTISAIAFGNTAMAQSPADTNDQRAKSCLALTAGGPGTASKLEHARNVLDQDILMDGVAVCRAAAASFPKQNRIVVGAGHAAMQFNLYLFGTDRAKKKASPDYSRHSVKEVVSVD